MTDTNKLKPCPFCGGSGKLKTAEHNGVTYSQVTCATFDCPANNTSSPPQSADDAVRNWNTRLS